MMPSRSSDSSERFARAQLQRMNIPRANLSLIRDKDGVAVWRVSLEDGSSAVLKAFAKVEYRREIANYQLLASIGVPTLRVIASTDCSLLLEDLDRSSFRLATAQDIDDPVLAEKIGLWYRALHQGGREYLREHSFIDEYDNFTRENLNLVRERTHTGSYAVWGVLEQHYDRIHAAVMSLPRTLVYTDFHFSNLAVARDSSAAIVFDYNFLFKSYAYSDIRNVCGNFSNAAAQEAFLTVY